MSRLSINEEIAAGRTSAELNDLTPDVKTAPLIQHTSASSVRTETSQSSSSTLFDMQRQNIRALSLIVCTFTYLMIGAAVFDALESGQDKRTRELVMKLEDKFQQKYNFSSKDQHILKTIVMKSIPQKAGSQWHFAGAFYFATVVITTVGYGHSTPATVEGKAFCIFYALAGIPLNLVMFQSIGERLNTLICYCLRKGKRWLRMSSVEVSMTHMIMVSSTLGFMVVFLGTYLFNKYERWGYFDSFYYCFITLTTIGFGDFVAMQKDSALENKTEYVVFSLLFILFGMALFAAAVNLFVLRFMATTSDSESLDKPRMKTIVLRGFSQDDTLNVVGHGPRSSSILVGETGRLHTITDSQGSIRVPLSLRAKRSEEKALFHRCIKGEKGVRPFSRCWYCYFRILRRLGFGNRPRYTVRRAPTKISHLINANSVAPDSAMSPLTEVLDTTSDLSSVPMHELRKVNRRPSI